MFVYVYILDYMCSTNRNPTCTGSRCDDNYSSNLRVEATLRGKFGLGSVAGTAARREPPCRPRAQAVKRASSTQHGEIPEAFKGPDGYIKHTGLVDKPISMILRLLCARGA